VSEAFDGESALSPTTSLFATCAGAGTGGGASVCRLARTTSAWCHAFH